MPLKTTARCAFASKSSGILLQPWAEISGMMRIAVASIGQETCSFTPVRTTLATFRDFGLYEGAEVFEKMQGVGLIGGFLAAMQHEPVQVAPLPIIQAWGGASGPLTDETLHDLAQRL